MTPQLVKAPVRLSSASALAAPSLDAARPGTAASPVALPAPPVLVAARRAFAWPVLVATALLAPALACAQVVNGDFSAGLAGWDTAGDASVSAAAGAEPVRLWLTTASVDFEDDAASGLAAGARNASGVGAIGTGQPGGLEDFAGVPLGALDPSPATGVAAFEGSAARQTFDATAGSTLHFRWDLGTLDAAQPDLAFVVIDGHETTLADASFATLPGVDGNDGRTGWQDFGFTFTTSGPHTIVFGVADVGDFDGTSTLAIADVAVSAVPEPASASMLLAGLGLGLAGMARRRRGR